MKNFIKGMGNIFNLFPKTDYMAMVPKKGEILRKAQRDFQRQFMDAYKNQTETHNTEQPCQTYPQDKYKPKE